MSSSYDGWLSFVELSSYTLLTRRLHVVRMSIAWLSSFVEFLSSNKLHFTVDLRAFSISRFTIKSQTPLEKMSVRNEKSGLEITKQYRPQHSGGVEEQPPD